MIHTVKLLAKTLKGKNKLREAGNPEHWTVIKEQALVGFSQKEGPWLFVKPQQEFHSRWVHLMADPDFIVEIVR